MKSDIVCEKLIINTKENQIFFKYTSLSSSTFENLCTKFHGCELFHRKVTLLTSKQIFFYYRENY